MCTLNTAVVEKRWIIKLGLLGLSLWYDSSCLTFTKSVIGVLGKKMGPKGRRYSQWRDLTQRKQIALSDSRSVGQDDKGCPILTEHVSATEMNLKVSGVWLLKVVSMLNVAIKR